MPATFYDIGLCPPPEESCCSPNPWKARYALNFKNAAYRTRWVELPDIEKVRKEVGLPASRKFADGSDFYTLPMLVDESTGAKLGDSFDIAIYLEDNYPEMDALFPEQSLCFTYDNKNSPVPLSEIRATEFIEYARFNRDVDAAFTAHVLLTVGGMPYDPKTIDAVKANFLQRVNAKSWDVFEIDASTRQALLASLKNMLGDLAQLYRRNPKGPFILGDKASFADFIVGGWLKMLRKTMPEWPEIRQWHNGIFGDLYDGLEQYADTSK